MKTIIAVTVCAMVLALTAPASALFGIPQTLEGTVESISQNSLAIISENGTTQQMEEVQINEETKFEGVASLDNLKKGDNVKVEYKEEGEEKIALSIAKVMEEDSQANSDYKS